MTRRMGTLGGRKSGGQGEGVLKGEVGREGGEGVELCGKKSKQNKKSKNSKKSKKYKKRLPLCASRPRNHP